MERNVNFDITYSKEFLSSNRDYYNSLANNCVELLDELLLLIEHTPVLKQLEYRYVNILVILQFVDLEYDYLFAIVKNLRDEGANINPTEFLMHLKNYLVHIDSFIDYLDGFLLVLSEETDEYDYRFDRKAIPEFHLINETRNQIHHKSLPTVDYNYYTIASGHADLAIREEVHQIMLRWPLSDRFTDTVDLSILLRDTRAAVKTQFEAVIEYLLQNLKKQS
ncbi:hypothetical protein GE107_21540 [Cohnella sp. CFH 77786]|uniref:hypothetical protein n=1 Tax=Cohnella sp. CFH 77786 TaxID=2662265 RepID=UPI001C609904|nr:hypothetical protein [Cohnella sp. CFH 77786]MBW5448634.1 hypothetical protein [Cohnella sp. CFH 77786]